MDSKRFIAEQRIRSGAGFQRNRILSWKESKGARCLVDSMLPRRTAAIALAKSLIPIKESKHLMSRLLTVIKAGTGVLTKSDDGTLDRGALVHLVSAIAALMDCGHRCLFVSSGAVGSGVSAFGLGEYPDDTATRQACAAVGQTRLMQTYSDLFANFDITAAQVLLTAEDLSTPQRARRVKDTIGRLLQEPRIIPIINENDSVAVEELKFGDNDMLSVQVAKLVEAQRVILLTTVDGLIDPATDQRIEYVEDIEDVLGHVKDEKGRFSIGGMASKLAAVKFAVEHGIQTHIAHGRHPERLADIVAGKGISTCFHAAKSD